MSTKRQDVQRLLGDLDPETFREWGHEIVDWIAEYLKSPEKYPVLSKAEPGWVRGRLPASPPEQPESFEAVWRDVQTIILPGLTHWNHPGFMAYFGITGSAPGILGELLCSAFNVNAMLWKTSPAATELEEVVLDWLRQMLGLAKDFQGIIYDTASTSTLHAIVAAREAIPGLDVREQGLAGRSDTQMLRLYTSEQAHSSVEKGAITAGIGHQNVRKIAVDSDFRMDTAVLERAIVEDLAAGFRPFCVVATVGTTSTTSIDPVPAIARICNQYGLWLHVDASYGGAASLLPEMRWVLDGCDLADSIVVNPHKWLFTPVDLSAFYCRRPATLKQAFSLVPEYLKTGQDDVVKNYMDYGFQLGRRFRALKLWFVIRTFGSEGMAARVREHIRLARIVADSIDQHPDFERMAPTPFSTVCFRAVPSGRQTPDLDGLNQRLLEEVNRSGEIFLSHTRLRGQLTLRMAIGNIRTDEAHVRRAWQLVEGSLAKLAPPRDPKDL